MVFWIEKGNHKYYIKPLSSKVLVVASINTMTEDWAAYIDAVEGYDHQTEWQKVASNGTTLPRDVAVVLFPDLSNKYFYRW